MQSRLHTNNSNAKSLMFQLCVVGNTARCIPNRRIQLEITVAQTYANNRIENRYYSSAVVHVII